MLNKGSWSYSNYILIGKCWSDQLVAVGKLSDKEDLISYIVRSLNYAYHPFITLFNFSTHDATINFDNFQTELLNYEYLIEAQTKYVVVENSIAFFKQKPKQ